MIRIRFHGRGGQGVKTASRIVGTAAFMEGYFSQDAPLYGAERRGAPIIAFTRIDKDTIFERGLIISPDIIIVADETLLGDPVANPLSGLREGGVVFVNTARQSADIQAGLPVPAAAETLDLTFLALDITSKPNVSPAVAGVVCRLVGIITEETLKNAVDREVSSLGVGKKEKEQSIALATRAYRLCPVVPLTSPDSPPVEKEFDRVVNLIYSGPRLGTANIMKGGTTQIRHTGNWRLFKPVIDPGKCKKCNICFVRCPDSCIVLDENGYPVIQYDNCKGCLICHEECPVDAISVIKEGPNE